VGKGEKDPAEKSLRICTLNTRSLVNKTVEVLEHINDWNCDICLVQETFFKTSDNAKLAEINSQGWSISSNPRKQRSGGGIAFLYRDDLLIKMSNSIKKYRSFQVMEGIVNCKNELIRLINVYRPPYTKKARYTETHFLSEFRDYLDSLEDKSGTPLIMGDFNLHVERPGDHYSMKFLSLLAEFGLMQCTPLSPTHKDGGTLDLIITTDSFSTKLKDLTIVPNGTTSDHHLVLTDMMVELSNDTLKTNKTISYRDFSNIDLEIFRKDVANSELVSKFHGLPLEKVIDLYDETLKKILDEHCPLIIKRFSKKSAPWRDKELKELITRRRKAERAWRKGTGFKRDYTDLVKNYKSLEYLKRCAFMKNSFENSAGNVKSLFKKVNVFLGKSKECLPTNTDEEILANDFGNFFTEKVNKIRSDIEAKASTMPVDLNEEELSDCAVSAEKKLNMFTDVTNDDIQRLIGDLPDKFCDLDPIPAFLLKECAEVLTPVLKYIINTSLKSATFPEKLKTAIISPIIKNINGDIDKLSNYRPVSNLPIISKIIEKAVLQQLNLHLESNNLYSTVQSGYRKHHSCETLLVRMSDDILKDINKDKVVVLLLLDLSAAFDTIDHDLLIWKLLTQYGIDGNALDWFTNYLSNRKFTVKINDKICDFFCLLFGVPQGSLLGPVLFVLYVKALENIARKYGLRVQMYADDSQLYITLDPIDNSHWDFCKDRIESCLKDIRQWMTKNFMKINESKTELLLIGKKRILTAPSFKSEDIYINFGYEMITPTECSNDNWKSLGVLLDPNFNFDRQISSLKKKCSNTMNDLWTMGKYLNTRTKLMLVKQLVMSKIDYCNAMYINLPATSLKRLQSILNHCIRYVYGIKDRTEDLTPYFRKAHILPIKARICFKACLLAYKVVNNTAPGYLKELVNLEQDVTNNDTGSGRKRLRSGEDNMRLIVPKLTDSDSKISGRRFTNYCPTEWNKLPLEIRSCSTVENFKSELKTYLFKLEKE